MTLSVRTISDRDQWNSLVDTWAGATPFHWYDALSVIADHAGADLHRLVGYHGGDAVGLFPVFEIRKVGQTAAFSPPPDLKVSYLGPVVADGVDERYHHAFVAGATDWIRSRLAPQYTHIRTSPGYDDPRPFDWNGYDLRARFTYLVDLDRDPDDLFDAFTSDVRKNVRTARDADCTVETVGTEGVEPIVSQVRERHEEQGLSYHVTPAFVSALVEALPDDSAFVYVCRQDGETLGGNIVLDAAGVVYGWQGVAKPDCDLPVNDFVHWRVMTDAIERGTGAYDMVGANDRRLSRYKAKFAPTIRQYQAIEEATLPTRMAASVYKRLK